MPQYLYHGSSLNIDELKESLLAEISDCRRRHLDRIIDPSVGVSIFDQETIRAARRYVAGDPSVMPNGMSPTDYLQGLGTEVGMHASQFAEQVIFDSESAWQHAYDAEKGFLACKFAIQTSMDGNALMDMVHEYTESCEEY